MKTPYTLLIAAVSALSLCAVACGGDPAVKSGSTTPTASASSTDTAPVPSSTTSTAPTAPAADSTATGPAPTPPPSTVDTGLFEQALAVAEKMVEIVLADQNNCDKMAADLKKYIDQNKDVILRAKEQSGKLSVAEKRSLQEKYMDRIKAMAEKSEKASKKCENNAKVKDAMKGLHE